jgi:4-hydroxy-tetrahydrodipicolinate synthase
MTEAVFHGVYAANICPFQDDFSVDRGALAELVTSIARVPGITGFLTNGHAGENYLLNRGEKREVLEVVRSAVGSDRQIIAGINAESSSEAAAEARDAERAGADVLLVFPPFSWATSRSREEVLCHHRTIIEAVDVPIMLYAAAIGTGGMVYEPELLHDLVILPRVVGIKDGSWEAAHYESNRRLVKSINPDCAVMASGDEHLMTCFVLGTDGSQVSLGCIIPELIVDLFTAVQAGDLPRAQAAHARIYPLAEAIYGTVPARHAHARIKRCLYKLGRLPSDRVRPPVSPVSDRDDAMLEAALRAAGLHEVLPA